jgi:glycosyltransferase involved in cell wall biosynthesis
LTLQLGGALGKVITSLIRHHIVSRALKRSRRVTVVSHSLLPEIGARIRNGVAVIYNGVSLPPTAPSQGRKPYFLYVGRLDPDKYVANLLNAYRFTGIEIPLKIAGNGSQAEVLRTEFYTEQFVFLGELRSHELPELYANALAFVTASPFETFCLPVIEAARQGCPCVAPRSGAMPEVVRDGATGYLLENFEAELFDALNKLARCAPKDREALGKRCKKWASRFDWSAIVPKYEEVFAQITAASPATRKMPGTVQTALNEDEV